MRVQKSIRQSSLVVTAVERGANGKEIKDEDSGCWKESPVHSPTHYISHFQNWKDTLRSMPQFVFKQRNPCSGMLNL
jgi:hypothetical protein